MSLTPEETLKYLDTVDKFKGLAISIPQITSSRLGTPDWTTGVEELRLAVLSALTQLKIQLDSIDAIGYRGTWDATTALPVATTKDPYKAGDYYIVSKAGTTTVDGISSWAVGDWIVYSKEGKWNKIPSTNAVTAVAGRQGAVILTKADIGGIENVDNTSDADKPISTAVKNALDDKVDKVLGKGLSTNDLTDALVTDISNNKSAISLLGTPVKVINDLATGGTTDALSAEQGKLLGVSTSTNATNINLVKSRVDTAENLISNHTTAIASLGTRIGNLDLDDIPDSSSRVAITAEEHSKMVTSDNYGHGNGIDADMVDGKHASYFYSKDNFNKPSVDIEAKNLNCEAVNTGKVTISPMVKPGSGTSGQIVFDSSDKKLYFWNDSRWVQLDNA